MDITINPRSLERGFLFGGAWRIRTAVDGFADRRLSHSSKAPFLECGCKGNNIYRYCQIFCSVFVAATCIFLFFLAYLPFQIASAASFTGVILLLYDLIYPPSGIHDCHDQDYYYYQSLPHNYSFVSFLSISLLITWMRWPRRSMSSRTLFILLKKSLKAFNKKFG